MSNADVIAIENLTDADLAALCATSTEVTDGYIADKLAHLNVIEVGDTIRFTGKRTNWIVGQVDGDDLEVYTFCGYGARTYRSIPARLDRVELVRKGNRIDDAIGDPTIRIHG